MDILHKLQGTFEGSEVGDGCIYLPDWGITIRPSTDDLKDNMAVLSFRVSAAEWDRELYECSVAVGNTQEKAVGMALGGFVFGMMDGIKQVMKDFGYSCGGCTCESNVRQISSEFAGARHNWRVYVSNRIGMGNTPENAPSLYWDMLSDEITKRLGNQKICYVKIYAAKNGENITGECRINDVMSPELSEKVAEYVRTWETDGFGSQKQFLLLAQDSDTYINYPHTPEKIADCVRLATGLFDNCKTDEEYDNFTDLLADRIGDADLAQELYMFLPEMCAENAFDKIIYSEDVGIYVNGKQESVYKTQIASYYHILRALHAEFARGNISNKLYNKYISVSSIYSVILEAKSKGADITNGGRLFVSYGAGDGYRLR